MNPTKTRQYDRSGYVVQQTDAAGTQTFEHNGLGKVRTVTHAGGTTRFVYGPSGAQVAVLEPASTTLRFDPAMEVVDGVVHWYVFSNGQRISERTSDGDLYWYVQDRLGSTRVILRDDQSTRSKLLYQPWGMASASVGTKGDTKYRFNGNAEDVDGVVDFNARSYAPRWGTMVSADPVTPSYVRLQSLNRYAYVENNPVSMVDPTGHAAASPNVSSLMKQNASIAHAAFEQHVLATSMDGFESAGSGNHGANSMQAALDYNVLSMTRAEAIAEEAQNALSAGDEASARAAIADAQLSYDQKEDIVAILDQAMSESGVESGDEERFREVAGAIIYDPNGQGFTHAGEGGVGKFNYGKRKKDLAKDEKPGVSLGWNRHGADHLLAIASFHTQPWTSGKEGPSPDDYVAYRSVLRSFRSSMVRRTFPFIIVEQAKYHTTTFPTGLGGSPSTSARPR